MKIVVISEGYSLSAVAHSYSCNNSMSVSIGGGGGCLTVKGYNCRLSVEVIVGQFVFLDVRRLSSLKRNMCKTTKSAMFSQSSLYYTSAVQ